MSASGRRSVLKIGAVGLLLVFGTAAVLWWWGGTSRWREERIRRAIVSTIQREAPASFYVTGTLDMTVTSTVKNTEVLLPGLLDWELGTATSTVRVPGRVYYGFDVRRLEQEDIHIRENGVVEVRLPGLRIYTVEPDLGKMEVETEAGWRRFYDLTVDERVERRAIAHVQPLLRTQGAAYLRRSIEPRLHTSNALEMLLTPILVAAGYADPRFRFRIDNRLVKEPER